MLSCACKDVFERQPLSKVEKPCCLVSVKMFLNANYLSKVEKPCCLVSVKMILNANLCLK